MKFKQWCSKHKTKLATGGGIAALIASNVLTGIATWRSIRKNDAIEAEIGRKTTKKEKVKVCWKYWVAPITTAGVGISSIIWSDKKQLKITSAALTACSIEKKNFDEYKQIVANKLDEKTQKEVEKEYAQKKVEEIELQPRKYECGVPEGDQVYCYDPMFNVKFIASPNEIQAGVNEFNSGQSQYISKGTVDDLYDFWGVPTAGRPSIVREMGWSEGTLVEVTTYEADVVDGIPRLLINYLNGPKGL